MPEGPVLITDVTKSQDWGKTEQEPIRRTNQTQERAESLGLVLLRQCLLREKIVLSFGS